jgi:hypothetical protein
MMFWIIRSHFINMMLWSVSRRPDVMRHSLKRAIGCGLRWMTGAAGPLAGEIASQLTDSEVFLRDMQLVSLAQMDAHYTHQWRACARWLQKNTDHEDAPALKAWLSASQQRYLRYEREALGWGVFVLQVGRTE